MEKKYIALTFDDGPSKDTTPALLEILKKYNVKASFFLTGNSITEQTVKYSEMAYAMGCELCNHSENHKGMSSLSDEEIVEEVNIAEEKIKKITGKDTVFFRPPYIDYNNRMMELIDKIFICGDGAEDWEPSVSAEERFERITKQAINGSVILLHDMEGNVNTVKAVEMIIPKLIEEGYEFVTMSELFGKCKVKAERNVIYSNVFEPR
ncbi:MAG: polysaccharide deacetylase family protein [Ruminiclostridium sp.]|nr:polysaccharide deacetylase family protein [Ruminiclostridium sp.]